jgi:hypothetical protein
LLDVRIDGAGLGLLRVTVAGEQGNRILSQFGKRKLCALCDVRLAGAVRTLIIASVAHPHFPSPNTSGWAFVGASK